MVLGESVEGVKAPGYCCRSNVTPFGSIDVSGFVSDVDDGFGVNVVFFENALEGFVFTHQPGTGDDEFKQVGHALITEEATDIFFAVRGNDAETTALGAELPQAAFHAIEGLEGRDFAVHVGFEATDDFGEAVEGDADFAEDVFGAEVLPAIDRGQCNGLKSKFLGELVADTQSDAEAIGDRSVEVEDDHTVDPLAQGG